MTDDLLQRWAGEIEDQLVDELHPGLVDEVATRASSVAAATGAGVAASATSGIGAGATVAGAGAAAGISTTVKVLAATTIAALSLAVAAASDALPDPIQAWVADVAEQIGVDLPRPDRLPSVPVPVEELSPDLPGVDPTLPTVPTIPDLTVPIPLPPEAATGDAVPGS